MRRQIRRVRQHEVFNVSSRRLRENGAARILPAEQRQPGTDFKSRRTRVSSPAELLIISLCGDGGWVFLRGRLASPGSPEWSGGFNRVTGAAAFSTTGNHFTPLPSLLPSLPPSLLPSLPPSLHIQTKGGNGARVTSQQQTDGEGYSNRDLCESPVTTIFCHGYASVFRVE